MSYSDEHKQLRNRFSSIIGNTPVDWPNDSYKPGSAMWVRFRIIDADAFQTSIGAPTNNHRHVGIVSIEIYAPEDIGNGAALVLADTIANGFRNWGGTSVQCRAASVKDVGPDGHKWWQVNVTIPFKRDELL